MEDFRKERKFIKYDIVPHQLDSVLIQMLYLILIYQEKANNKQKEQAHILTNKVETRFTPIRY